MVFCRAGKNESSALPGDKLEEYQRMLDMLPLIRHLHPPLGLAHLSIERFSRYFAHPEEYGIKKVSYLDSYRAVLPQHADVMKILISFSALPLILGCPEFPARIGWLYSLLSCLKLFASLEFVLNPLKIFPMLLLHSFR